VTLATPPAGAARLERRLADELEALAAEGLLRRLEPPAGVDFASNDYLGLAASSGFATEVARRIAAAAAAGTPLFAPASRLLRGQLEAHAELEARVARWKGAERALVLPSGWQAVAALLSGIVRRGDVVVSDRLNHASAIDGIRLARAEKRIVPHLDLAACERELGRPHGGGEVFVLVESLYSMDGDLAPLAELAALCARHGAHLLVDDAHAAGLYGKRGSGWIEEQGVERGVAASITTFGKALGVQGAAIAGSRALIELLVQRARPFVFSTALSPLLVHAVQVALDVVAAQPERRARVHANSRRLRARLAAGGLPVDADGSPIVPVVVGDNERAVETARRVQARGFDVRAVRPPTVPDGTARLRLSVHADRTDAELDAVADAVLEAVAAADADRGRA
jgi:8-amino-7-oxononanoate synthase